MSRISKKRAARKSPASRPPRQRRPPAHASETGGKDVDAGGDRLQKVLAAAGVASRRESEKLILEGRVEVDGQVVSKLGARADRSRQTICVDGEPLRRTNVVYYAVHKPEGVVCTAKDPSGRPRVTDLLPAELGRLFSVGRLDMSSEGLILLTNDGALANQLTHPRHGVKKTYEVKVAGYLDPTVLTKLKKGVHLAEGFARVVHVRIKSRRKNATLLEMVLDEGRNREIRRLLARVGHRVQRLTRVAVGSIRLGEMPVGSARRLSAEEVKKLRADVQPAERKPRQHQRAGATRQAAPVQRTRKQTPSSRKRTARPSPKGDRR
ncbi:MAG: rRNA pseudouridine synthase [Pirellulales bacterium]|nr:rRNA pseudouridine synthase [Pirellulales bacterium]